MSMPDKYARCGYEQVTNLSSAVGLTVPAAAMAALIQAQGAVVRWRDDGTDPTASVGMRLLQDFDMWYTGDLSSIRFIQESASGVLNLSYYG